MICNIIPAVLDRLPRGEDGKCPVKVGFLTYGHTISFFNLSKELSQPQMMVSSNYCETRILKFELGCWRC